ncbi:MAG: hypothetical protein K2F95_00750 [Alistipes sp.]|nr:hypothetical protein [Alistipes sp.]
MLTNAARQKFPEASLILLAAAVCAVVDASHMAPAAATEMEYAAPLAMALGRFQRAWPTFSAIMSATMIMYVGLSLTRTALRRYLYPVHTLVGIPLTGIVVCGFGLSAEYLSTAVLLLIVAMIFKRLYICFGRDEIVPQLFPAMVYLGCTPLLHAPMTAFVVLLIPIIIVCRLSLRNCVAAVAGALLPVFVVSYLGWAGGGEFCHTAYGLWRAMLTPAGFDAESYLTVAHLALLGMTLFATVCSVILYRSDRFAVSVTARKIWNFTIAIMLLAVGLFIGLPSSGHMSIAVVSLLASTLMPMFFVRMENYISSSLYWLMIAAAIWSLNA